MSGKSVTSQIPLAPFSSTSSTHKTVGQSSISSTAYSESTSGNPLLRIDDLGSTDPGHRHHGEPVHRAQRGRNPGGFLLQSPLVPPVSSYNAAKRSAQQGSEDIKGKSRIEQGGLAIPKRRKTRQRPLKKAAVGNSPLSIELFNAAPARVDDGQPRTSDSTHIPADASRAPDARHLPEQDEPRQGAASGLGDPAQIVNLALNLSESRRRTFSASRISPMGLGNRRIPSLNQHSTLSANPITGTVASGGSLRQYMQPQRQASRNVSPRSNKRRDRDISFPPSPWKPDSRTPQIAASEFDIDVVDEVSLKISDATLARAEKARVALELCYEYRRLLDYLPTIPRPWRNKSALSRPPTKPSTEPIHVLGREYNPLQYVRNRRMRGRERKMLDAEGDGWKDLERVRNWVDTVAHEREAKTSSPTALYSLPSFESFQTKPSSKAAPSDSTALYSAGPSNNKPRRTKLDWSITAWDLLADAYWLCQDENWKNTEHPNTSKIVLSKDTHLEAPPRTSPESARSKSVTEQHMTPEKSNSLMTISRNGSRERGRQHMREPNTPVSNDNGSRDRKRRWARGFVRSHSLSSSNGSVDGGGLRDSDVFARDHPDNAILEKQMQELLKKEAEAKKLTLVKRDSLEGNPATSASMVNTGNSAGFGVNHLEGLRHIRSHSEQVPELIRPTHEKKGRQLRYSLDEPFTASLKNSSSYDFDPGRASDSSPLGSRSVNSSRKPRDEDTQSINGEGVRPQSKVNTSTAQRDLTSSKTHDLPYRERIANFGNGLLSPMTPESLGRKFKRADVLSSQPVRDIGDTDSRLRSFFKGAKAAGFAGNEVHKTVSKMQKKENQYDSPHHHSLVDDVSEDYDNIEADMSELDSSPEDDLSQSLIKNDELMSMSHKATATATDRTIFHVNHLPGFRSPFKKTEHDSVIPKGSSNDDHITRQQMAQRAQGRSIRFDRLAPPKIDIEGISPTASVPLTPTQVRDTDASHDGSRRSSDSQSDARLHDIDRRLQRVLGSPGTIANGPPVSLLSGLESGQHRVGEHGNIQGERQWSISDRGLSPVRGNVSKREIARARALLLSSGVKANEIVRRAQEVRESPSALLRELQTRSTRPLPKVPRLQEHILAARVIISNIETSNRQLKEVTENFSCNAVEILAKIEALRNHVSEKLTPAVGAAADDADVFSSELTIAHTLAVKQLHDSVNILIRRRRRKFRWIRRGGYVMLEWEIMCIMWCVWFVVVFIRAVRGIIGAMIRGLLLPEFDLPGVLRQQSVPAKRVKRSMLRRALPLSRNACQRSIGLGANPRPIISGRTSRALFSSSKSKDLNTKPSIHDSDAVVLPGSQSTSKTAPAPPAPGPIASISPSISTPATPSENKVIAPESVPRVPPPPPRAKIQNSPPTSIPKTTSLGSIPPTPPPTATAGPVTPPPPQPRRKSGRLRRFLLYLFLLGGLSYTGGVYYSLVSDNFHDFFTEYVPFGEDAVLYFEEREFRKRFPRMTNPTNRPLPDSGSKITIPSRSGVSWKISEENNKGAQTKSSHITTVDDRKPSAIQTMQQTPSVAINSENTNPVQQAKKAASSQNTADSPKIEAPNPATEPRKNVLTPKPEPSVITREAAVKKPEVNEPSVPKIIPIDRIDPIHIKNADEPLVQDLVKILNDIITVINADNASAKYSSTIGKAKSEFANVGKRIRDLKELERLEAQRKIRATELEFDKAAQELVRRLEEQFKIQESVWQDEFESEREKISQSYQERLENELKRSEHISEQRLRNSLLEQAIELKKKFIDEVKDRVEAERNGRLSKLSDLSSSVSELESLTTQWNSVLDANLKTQHLQVAVEAVRASLDQADRPRPFVHELATLKELARDNPVVNAAIASINPSAYQRGIPTSAELIERFRRVAAEVRKASLLPVEEDAGVAAHAVSNVLSRFIFKKQKGRVDGDDVDSVLARTETLLEEGKLDDAAREMNVLEGWAKILSADWIAEARRVLEVRQAMDVMAAEVRLQALGVD